MYERLFCRHCGAALEPCEENWCSSKGKWYKSCASCREDRVWAYQKKKTTPEKDIPKTKAAEPIIQRCNSCRRILARYELGKGLCTYCQEKESKGQYIRIREKPHSMCLYCEWARFDGESLSCLTRAGTGPTTGDCLKYKPEFEKGSIENELENRT